jgi:hypothetical protein
MGNKVWTLSPYGLVHRAVIRSQVNVCYFGAPLPSTRWSSCADFNSCETSGASISRRAGGRNVSPSSWPG